MQKPVQIHAGSMRYDGSVRAYRTQSDTHNEENEHG
ncbi:hypothetical protein J2797_000904 [Paraburkholderia terricola]|nr:hypothetical protein [Paraburkholderia terricola]